MLNTNAALNILQKGMSILGIEWQNGTSGHEGSASENEGKTEEKTTSTIEEKSTIGSGLR